MEVLSYYLQCFIEGGGIKLHSTSYFVKGYELPIERSQYLLVKVKKVFHILLFLFYYLFGWEPKIYLCCGRYIIVLLLLTLSLKELRYTASEDMNMSYYVVRKLRKEICEDCCYYQWNVLDCFEPCLLSLCYIIWTQLKIAPCCESYYFYYYYYFVICVLCAVIYLLYVLLLLNCGRYLLCEERSSLNIILMLYLLHSQVRCWIIPIVVMAIVIIIIVMNCCYCYMIICFYIYVLLSSPRYYYYVMVHCC